METSLAGLVSFLTMKNRLEMAFQGGRKGRGDCSPGIMYHPNCLRRLLDRHYAHPYCLRRLLAADFQPTVSSSESDILF